MTLANLPKSSLLRFRLPLLALAAMLSATAARAQGSFGAISGTITDSTGAVVPQATITATHEQTGVSSTTTSDGAGLYTIQALPVGSYKVTVALPGFKTVDRTEVIISTARTTNLDVRLEPGDVSQTIDVAGTPPPLQTNTAEISTIAERRVMMDLPLQLSGNTVGASGKRQLDSFIFLTPGVTGNQYSKSINGSGQFTAELIIDGLTAAFSQVSGVIGNFSPPYEAVEEFNVQTSQYSAEAGRGFGVQQFTLKSGTSDFHGDAFEFLRNDKFDSRGFFQRAKPHVRQHEFGGTIGGPIIKEKTFFFAAFQQFRKAGGAALSATTLPTVRMKQGDFSQLLAGGIQIYDPNTTKADGKGGFTRDPFPGNIIPQSRWDPSFSKLLPLIPDPQIDTPVNNYVSPGGAPVLDNAWSVKIDHMISSRQKISGTYWWMRDRFPFDPVVAGELTDSVDRVQKGGGIRVNYDFTLSPRLLNHFGFGYARRDAPRPGGSSLYPTNKVGNEILGIPNLANLKGWPCFRAAGYANLGNLCISPLDEISTNFAFLDNLSWTKGRHLFKFGVDVRLNRSFDTYNSYPGEGGMFGFSSRETSLPDSPNFGRLGDSFASALLGEVDSASHKVGVLGAQYRSPYWGLFVQDEYRITPKLTANYGLRLDRPSTFYESDDRMSALSLTAPNPGAGGRPGALVFVGSGPGRTGSRSLAPSYFEWGPRLGLAYAFNQKTVIRTGFGLFYAPSNGNAIDTVVIGNLTDGYEFVQSPTSTDNGLTPAFILSQGFPAFKVTLPDLDPSLKNGSSINYFNSQGGHSAYLASWDFSVERELPGSIVLDVAYVGNKGTHVPSSLDNVNQLNPSYLSLGGLLSTNIASDAARAAGIGLPYAGFSGSVAQALRPFPQYTSIAVWADPSGNSSYEAMQLKAQRRFSQGLALLLSYTFSKSLTDTQDTVTGFSSFPMDTYNRKLEKSVAANDMPHVLVGTFLYELPVGPRKRFLKMGGIAGKLAGGWQISGTTRYSSGTPLAISGGPSLPLFNGGNRPNRVLGTDIRTNVGAGSFDPANNLYLNINAFSQPTPFTFGDVGRYLPNVRGFGFMNEDLVLIKRTHVTESKYFETRGEFFNAFNRVVFANPAASINNPLGFGRVSGQANVPRIIQLGAKFVF